jgi:hypothetical protein
VFLIYTPKRFVIATKEKCDCYGSLSTMKSIIYLLFVVHNIPMGSGVYNCRHLSHTFHVNHGTLMNRVNDVVYDGSFTAHYSVVSVKDEFSNETALLLITTGSSTAHYYFLPQFFPVPTVTFRTHNHANISFTKDFYHATSDERSRFVVKLPKPKMNVRVSCIDFGS